MATRKLWDSCAEDAAAPAAPAAGGGRGGADRAAGGAPGAAAPAAGLDPAVEAFLSSVAVDSRLLREDLRGSRAHAAMLGARGIVAPEAAAALDAGLAELEAEAAAREAAGGPGAVGAAVDPEAEDVHSWVEGELTARLGEAGKALHAGRSRNDQVALDLSLWLRGASSAAAGALRDAIGALCDLAARHAGTIMPGYTHLQRAQPVTFAHHLLAWGAALERDLGRFRDAAARMEGCPLGACALAGSGLPLDREATAAALGYARPGRNSMDDVADRDAAVEFAAACATLLMHLSRYCEEIVLWSSAEFGFVRLGPSCSTGSSVMPQKRNPDPAELIRGKAGRAYGALLNLLVLQKGLPLAYDRDLQEDKAAVFEAADTALGCLGAFAAMLRAMEPRPARMRAAAEQGCLWAADAAEFLVLRGVPFRTAYVAGRKLVEAWAARAEADPEGRGPATRAFLEELGDGGLAALHPAWAAAAGATSGADAAGTGGATAAAAGGAGRRVAAAGTGLVPALADWLDLEACVARRDLVGGPAPARTLAEIERLRGLMR